MPRSSAVLAQFLDREATAGCGRTRRGSTPPWCGPPTRARGELALGVREVEREQRARPANASGASAAFFSLATKRSRHVRRYVRKLPLLRIVAVEEFLLDGAREESLRQVLRVLVRLAEAQAQIFVGRLPIRLDEDRESPLALQQIGALRRENRGVTRGGKAVAPARRSRCRRSWSCGIWYERDRRCDSCCRREPRFLSGPGGARPGHHGHGLAPG